MPHPLDWIISAIKAGSLTVPAVGDPPPSGQLVHADGKRQITQRGSYDQTMTHTYTLEDGTCSGRIGVAAVSCDLQQGTFSFQKTFHSVWSGNLLKQASYDGASIVKSFKARGNRWNKPVGETRDYSLPIDCPLADAVFSIVSPGESTGADLINIRKFVENFTANDLPLLGYDLGSPEGYEEPIVLFLPPSTLPVGYACQAAKNYGVKLSYPKNVVKIGFTDGAQYTSFAILPCADKAIAEGLLDCLKQLQQDAAAMPIKKGGLTPL